jgi:hypothetical protein
MKEQKAPEWFLGTIYSKGDTVTNPFSGQSIELTAVELSIYDFIMGAQMFANSGIQKEVRKGLDWFIKENPDAYMVLLD